MIKDELTTRINDALKAGDDIRVSTLRLLSNALHNEEIAKQKELSEEEELQIVRRQLKQRDEAIEALRQAQGKLTSASQEDLEARLKKEAQEAEILKEFLPAQMVTEELEKIVEQVISEVGASGPQDFGKVMGQVMARVKGQADGNKVAEVVKQKLT